MTRKAYTIAEVAAMLGHHRSTIWRWLKSGVLQEVRGGGIRRMVSAASVHQLVGEITVEVFPPPAPPTGKRGRPRIEGVRPWQAEGVSRRTWERRQKERA